MFIYFLPDVREVTPEVISQFGLNYLFDSPQELNSITGRDVTGSGPDGLRGKMIAPPGVSPMAVKMDEQLQWKKFPKSWAEQQAYCCWREIPSPDELLRGESNRLDGHRVAGGWLVPVARDAGGSCSLPMVFDLDDETGKLVATQVKQRYAKLWKVEQDVFTEELEAMAAKKAEHGDDWSGAYEFKIPSLEDLISEAFGANHRVSLRELTIMQVIDNDTANEVLHALRDGPSWEVLQKKTQDSRGIPESTNTFDGETPQETAAQ